MKTLGRAWCLLALLLVSSCSNGKIALEYKFAEEEGTTYLWKLQSRTEVNSTTEDSVTTLSMEVQVHEEVVGGGGSDPVLEVTITPRSVKEGNSSRTTPEPTTIAYELDSDGHPGPPVTDDLDGPIASAVQLGSTLASTRLALPDDPVGIGDEWDAQILLDGDLGNIDLAGTGKLLGFELAGKRRLARIETTRSGEIFTFQQRGGVPVELRGTTNTNAVSKLDIDAGVLYSSADEFVSEFNILSSETGKLLGTMTVTLTSELELQPA